MMSKTSGEAGMTKIDERRAREEYDRQNPWRSMEEGVPQGLVCELLYDDLETSRERLFFLHEDRKWYRCDSSGLGGGSRKPMNWRPATPQRRLNPTKRGEIVTEASKRGW